MSILTENLHPGAFIVSEGPGFYSRDAISMSNAVTSVPGTVLTSAGTASAETATVAANANNTGNGTVTMDPTTPVGPAALDGVYSIEMSSATNFIVVGPNGKPVGGKGTLGTEFVGPVAFTVAAGATPFVAGDGFAITVFRPDSADTWAPLDAGFVGLAAGILFGFVPPYTSATTYQAGVTQPGVVAAVAIRRNAEVRASDLTWPVGATAAQIAEATLQLKRIGIILR